jgi:hypothetical protein
VLPPIRMREAGKAPSGRWGRKGLGKRSRGSRLGGKPIRRPRGSESGLGAKLRASDRGNLSQVWARERAPRVWASDRGGQVWGARPRSGRAIAGVRSGGARPRPGQAIAGIWIRSWGELQGSGQAIVESGLGASRKGLGKRSSNQVWGRAASA